MKNSSFENQQFGTVRSGKWRRAAALVCFLAVALAAQVGQASLPQGEPGEAASAPREVRVATVKGFNLAFMLVDQGSVSSAADGELLLFIGGPDGQPVRDAAVKYTVVDPDGATRTASAQAARGGYRTLVDWQAPGTYLVQAEVTTGKGAITDRFVCQID